MTISQLNGCGRIYSGLRTRSRQHNPAAKTKPSKFLLSKGGFRDSCAAFDSSHNLSIRHRICDSGWVTRGRRPNFPAVYDQVNSDYGVGSADVDERLDLSEENVLLSHSNLEEFDLRATPVHESVVLKEKSGVNGQSHSPDVKRELVKLTLPAILGQAIEPLTLLMETAYIGRLGSVELASAGVSISIFNIVSKLFNIPLLSVATSFVAEDIAKNTISSSKSEEGNLGGSSNGKPQSEITEKQQLSSVSTALLLSLGIGVFEAVALSFGSGPFLNLMGVSSASSMHGPAQRFLVLRAIGAPAVVLTLALQGIFRGFKDTKTPVICLGIGNLLAVILFPVLIYYCQMGVTGAAISTVMSQYVIAALMIWHLSKKVLLLPPKLGSLQFGDYIKSGGFLLGRTLAVLFTMTLGTSMAARQGANAMAAHQICMQVWLAVSLLSDSLAASGQALVASYLSKGDFKTVREITNFVLKIGLFAGASLSVILGLSFSSLATLFTKDANVIDIIRTGVLFVSASQPINALAFIFDGLHYGVSDFPYAAVSMMLVGAISSAFLLYAPQAFGLSGVWCGLTLFMSLRMLAGIFRLLSKNGPWWFLHADLETAQLAR